MVDKTYEVKAPKYFPDGKIKIGKKTVWKRQNKNMGTSVNIPPSVLQTTRRAGQQKLLQNKTLGIDI